MAKYNLVESKHWNAVYLLSSICTIFMAMVVAIQPVFLRTVLDIPFDMAGTINANIQVVTEVCDLLLIGYLGYLSDRLGRVPVIVYGFLVAAIGALFVPFSVQLGAMLGVGGIVVYYLLRIVMSLGTGAVWPQIATVSGDFTHFDNRARMLAKAAFMMAFGATLVYAVLMQLPQYIGITGFMLLGVIVALFGAWVAKRCLIDVAEPLEDKGVPWREVTAILRRDARVRLAFAAAFFSRSDMLFVGMFLMLWYIYFSDLVHVNHEEAVARAGIMIGLAGFVMLVAIPVWGAMIERYGRIPALSMAMGVSALGCLMLGGVVNPFDWEILLPVVFIAFGQAGCLISPQAMVLDLSPENIRGSMLGFFNVVGGIGVVVCIQVGGIVFDAIGPYAPFVFIGVANLFIVLYSLTFILRKNSDALLLKELD
ncbi:MAG: MFS transporter [Zetaproteobacteria bacterium]|nr:MFS transporter [Zetaproteobacteria bacterium]